MTVASQQPVETAHPRETAFLAIQDAALEEFGAPFNTTRAHFVLRNAIYRVVAAAEADRDAKLAATATLSALVTAWRDAWERVFQSATAEADYKELCRAETALMTYARDFLPEEARREVRTQEDAIAFLVRRAIKAEAERDAALARAEEAERALGRMRARYHASVESGLAETARAEAAEARLARAVEVLKEIANEQQYRSGYCQTDITVEPLFTAEEAQQKARDFLSESKEAGGGRPSGWLQEHLDEAKATVDAWPDSKLVGSALDRNKDPHR